jgi:DNA end-binding protein Ku
LVMRGKEHLALIRPYENVLMSHTMHYADEIRPCREIVQSARRSLKSSELKLAERLIEGLSKEEFGAEQFEDTYRRI